MNVEKVFVIENEQSDKYEQFLDILEVLVPDFQIPVERASGTTLVNARAVRNITLEKAWSAGTQKCWLNFKVGLRELNGAKSAVLDQRQMKFDVLRFMCVTRDEQAAALQARVNFVLAGPEPDAKFETWLVDQLISPSSPEAIFAERAWRSALDQQPATIWVDDFIAQNGTKLVDTSGKHTIEREAQRVLAPRRFRLALVEVVK